MYKKLDFTAFHQTHPGADPTADLLSDDYFGTTRATFADATESTLALSEVCRRSKDVSNQAVSTAIATGEATSRLGEKSARRFEAEQDQMEREARSFRRDVAALNHSGADTQHLTLVMERHRCISGRNHDERLRRLAHENIFFTQRARQDDASMGILETASREVAVHANLLGQMAAAQHRALLDTRGLQAASSRDLRVEVASRRESELAAVLEHRRLDLHQREVEDLSEQRSRSMRLGCLQASRDNSRQNEWQTRADDREARSARHVQRTNQAMLDIELQDRNHNHRLRQNEQDFQQTQQLLGSSVSIGQIITGFGT